MCLAVPMRVEEIRPDNTAVVSLDGSITEVSISLLENVKVGDFVIIHAGFAIESLDTAQAEEILGLFKEMADAAHGKGSAG